MESIARQMIDFQKTTFDNTFNTIVKIQDQAEKMTAEAMSQMTWLPEEGRKAIDNSIEMFKKARDDYKKAVNDGFAKIEEIFV
jgi:sugar-specific transcriptional regulator TrmB